MRALAFAAAAAMTAASAPALAQTATFDISGVRFSVPIPKGYCLPSTEADVSRMRFAASLDRENQTALSLIACGGANDPFDYILVKTPVALLQREITLQELMTVLGPEFDKPVGADIAMPDVERTMGDALAERTGSAFDIGVAVGPRGRDEVCAYSGGTITEKNKGEVISLGSCTTVVSGRMFSIHIYARGGDPATVRRLLPRGRAFALSMSGKK